MIIGLSLDDKCEYISQFDPDHPSKKPDGHPTKFSLQTLDSRVMGHLRDRSTRMSVKPGAGPDDSVDTEIAMNEVAFETVQFGLTGIEGLVDQHNTPIAFKTQKRHLRGKSYEIAHEDIISRLPMKVIAELSGELRKLNNMGEEEGNG
jgi:hypothetical protein